jgi:hypothetical protein
MLESIIEVINEVLFRDKGEVQWEKLTDPNLHLAPRDTPYLFKLGKKIAKVRLQYTSSYLDSKGVSNDQTGS